MTNNQKYQITTLLSSGLSVAEVARELGMSDGTVRSFLRRKSPAADNTCKYCGAHITQLPGRKRKQFCSEKCRKTWWNRHRGNYAGEKTVTITCEYCGKEFRANENAHRKYCSRTCYDNSRRAAGTDR